MFHGFAMSENFSKKHLQGRGRYRNIFLCDADMAQLVEHHLAKVGVAGSNPVSLFPVIPLLCLAFAKEAVAGDFLKSAAEPTSPAFPHGFLLFSAATESRYFACR